MFLGRPDGDWSGRHTKDLRSDRLVGWLRDLTKKSNTGKTLEAV
jgi:hypothetical protein